MVVSVFLWMPLSAVLVIASIILLIWLFMVVATSCLALATRCRQSIPKQNSQEHHTWRSGLFQGRVGHTRFHPKSHSFAYPLYIFLVDLEEIDDLLTNKLWPLSKIVSFRVKDHMKHDPTLGKSTSGNSRDLSEKIFQVIEQKSSSSVDNRNNNNNNNNNNATISSATHRILLATQLSYWGYCFNPVSFYYAQNKSTNQIDVMVAEVSNTPWGEMHDYVLRLPPREFDNNNDQLKKARNYKFDKSFHVSPFMEMNYVYDWTFQEQMGTNGIVQQLDVITSMKTKKDRLQFTARMKVERQTSFWSMVIFLLQYPMFCLVIQIWIHYEAFRLFAKGIPYIPHPTGSETAASRIIGTLMVPLFALQDSWKKLSRRSASQKDVGKKTA